jgi:hypothetical protein
MAAAMAPLLRERRRIWRRRLLILPCEAGEGDREAVEGASRADGLYARRALIRPLPRPPSPASGRREEAAPLPNVMPCDVEAPSPARGRG